ncbi:serine hydrolase domain-containing protein [Streptomyces carpaticus]|uniref:Serine hydrolase domain-containing protein n=1 Tax=Streptomyces carpaticus TaxID=285558 RepID=A0ABV4ZN12_9ACTN
MWGAAGREGTARAGDNVPWNAHFRVGSITKTFTATVALQLADEGTLSLDDTVEQWLPGAVSGHGNDASRITLTNLLRQTSGLNDYDEDLPWVADFTAAAFTAQRFRVHRPEELIAWAASAPPQWQPGPENPSAFPGDQDLVDTSVFVPLPDASVISTAADLTTFYRVLLGGDLLPPHRLAQMRQTVEAPDMADPAPGARYGLGTHWRPAQGCEHGIRYHGGTMPGYLSHLAVTPDGRRAVAVSATTWRPGDERQDQQDAASLQLADKTPCARTRHHRADPDPGPTAGSTANPQPPREPSRTAARSPSPVRLDLKCT